MPGGLHGPLALRQRQQRRRGERVPCARGIDLLRGARGDVAGAVSTEHRRPVPPPRQVDQGHHRAERVQPVQPAREILLAQEGDVQAAEALADEASVEVIDLRCLVPWDRETVIDSLEKTGRLVVVQEDNRSCSFGQSIIGEIVDDPDSWYELLSPPKLVSRTDVPIGFNPILEYAALPSLEDVIAAIRTTMEE